MNVRCLHHWHQCSTVQIQEWLVLLALTVVESAWLEWYHYPTPYLFQRIIIKFRISRILARHRLLVYSAARLIRMFTCTVWWVGGGWENFLSIPKFDSFWISVWSVLWCELRILALMCLSNLGIGREEEQLRIRRTCSVEDTVGCICFQVALFFLDGGRRPTFTRLPVLTQSRIEVITRTHFLIER